MVQETVIRVRVFPRDFRLGDLSPDVVGFTVMYGGDVIFRARARRRVHLTEHDEHRGPADIGIPKSGSAVPVRAGGTGGG